MSKPIYIVYMHTCTITGKSYIGQTSVGIEKRWNRHVQLSNDNNYNLYFLNAIKKYGKDNWDHVILFSTPNKNIIHDAEIFLIAMYDTFHNGYNTTMGGDGSKGGKDHHMYGKHHTTEANEKNRKSHLGKNSSFLLVIIILRGEYLNHQD